MTHYEEKGEQLCFGRRLRAWEKDHVTECREMLIFIDLHDGLKRDGCGSFIRPNCYIVSNAYQFLVSMNHDIQTINSNVLCYKAISLS